MGRRLALLVGTTRYDDVALTRLQAPEADLRDLADVLRTPEICGFDDVSLLLNASAQQVNVAVCQFFSNGKPDDLLLLYFSGHGVLDPHGSLFLCASDTRKGLLRATALPASLVRDEMDSCRSRCQLLILDCCHAGAFAQNAKGIGLGVSVGTQAAFEGTGVGRVVLTASDATQFALEGDAAIGELRQSIFTRNLIQALRTGVADVDGNGVITVDEVYDFVYQRVLQENPLQTPGKWTYKQQGDIVFARNPRPAARRDLLDRRLVENLETGVPHSLREAAVKGLSLSLRDTRPGVVLASQELLLGCVDDDSRSISALARHALEEAGVQIASNGGGHAERPSGTSVQQLAAPEHNSGSLRPPAISQVPVPTTKRNWGYVYGAAIAALAIVALAWRPLAGSRSSATPSQSAVRSTMPSHATIEVLANDNQTLTLTLDNRVIGPLPQIVQHVSPGEHELLLEGQATEEPYRKKVTVRPGANLTMGPIYLRSRACTLTITRDEEFRSARVFLIEDGHPSEITEFPHVTELHPSSKYGIEAILKDRQFTQLLTLHGQQNQSFSVDAKLAWRMSSPAASAKAPMQAGHSSNREIRLDVRGSTGACQDGVQRLQYPLNRLKAALKTCLVDTARPGDDHFEISIGNEGMISRVQCNKGTVPEALHKCFHRAIANLGKLPDLAGVACPLSVAIGISYEPSADTR